MTSPDFGVSDEGGVPADRFVEQALRCTTVPAVVEVVEHFETNLRWAANTLTTNGEMRSRTLRVTATAAVNGGTAVVTLSQDVAELDQVAAVVAAAEAAAKAGPPAPEAAPLVPDDPDADHDGADPEPARTGIDTLAGVAAGLGAAFERARAEQHLLYGFAEHIVQTVHLGSTTGLRRRGVRVSGRFELNGKSADLTRSAWIGQATRTFDDVAVADLYAQLRVRLEWARRQIDLPPGRYETLLPPGTVADLLIYAYWTANARDAEQGRNVFAAGRGETRIGQRLTESALTLSSDPHYPGLETLPFVTAGTSADGTSWAFDAGSPVPAVDWIRDGVLTELVRNRAHAAATDQAPTPPAENLIADAGGTASLEQMIASTRRGLLLTCFWYIREVDPERLLLTGLTRDGVYLIEDGEVVGAVNNFRWNESPVELLGRISEIGAAEATLCREWNDYFTATVMPPVRVPDFNMSTLSRAS